MNNPQNLPPELVRQIQENLKQGKPLPPGVISVPAGQAPPPGVIPTGITAQAMPGAMHEPGVGHDQRAQARLQQNPLPEGPEGMQILRSLSDCPIPAEAQKLQAQMKVLISSESTDDELIERTLMKGLVTSLRADRYCQKQLRTRTVCIFDQDEKLQKLHEDVNRETELLEELQQQIRQCTERGKQALLDRWNYAVKTYGLAPERFAYRINEEDGTIELLELKCESCKGATNIRKARQETAELVLTTGNTPGGKKNDDSARERPSDGTPEGDAGESGETRVQEQEVSGVADSTDIDDSDGNNSADQTD